MTIRPSVLLSFIVLFGFFARAGTYKAPLLDHHSWRQADTASIARNFSRERLNILYPQVDQRGARQVGYVETGLELFAFVVALIATVTGFHHEIGRVLSAAFFIGSCLLMCAFVRRRYDERTALIAAYLYAFGFPLMLFMERAFMNEAMLVFLSIAALTSTQRYLGSGRRSDLIVLLLATSTIAAVKLPYLIIWMPILGLFVERYRSRTLARWELLALAALNLTIAALWYTHAHRLAAETGLSFGLSDKLFDPAVVFSAGFPLGIVDRLFGDVLGPIVFAAAAVGLCVTVKTRRWCEVGGVAGFVIYVIVVAIGNREHDYYQLAIMPVAPALAALGIARVADWKVAATSPTRRDTVLAVLLALAAVSTFMRLVSANSWFEYPTHDVEWCKSVQAASQPAERIVFVYEGNPRLMFCSDRKGWLLDAKDLPSLQETIAAGGRLVVLPRELDAPEIRAFLNSQGRLIAASPANEVFRVGVPE